MKGWSGLPLAGKMAVAIGFSGALFLAVVWLYHRTLFTVLDENEHLLSVEEEKKSLAMEINLHLLEARQKEKDYLLRPDPAHATQVGEHVHHILARTAALGKLDEGSRAVAADIAHSIGIYHEEFLKLVAAWQRHGLTQRTGLQGTFLKAVEEVERMLDDLDTSQLKITFWEMRHNEKEYLVSRKNRHLSQFRNSAALLSRQLAASRLSPILKEQIAAVFSDYLKSVESYVQARGGETAVALDDPLYQAMGWSSREVEGLLDYHFVPGIWQGMSDVRKNESQYLLRHQDRYIDQMLVHLGVIQENLDASRVDEAVRKRILESLSRYKEAFIELAAQIRAIDEHLEAMNRAARAIEPLVLATAAAARKGMAEESLAMRALSRQRATWALLLSLGAFIVGAVLATRITTGIVRPIHTLSLVTERVAAGDLRVAVDFDRHDEVGLLGGAMNRMTANLKETVTLILEEMGLLERASRELTALSSRMSVSSQVVLGQATETAAATEQTSENMGTISTAVTQASQNLQEISALAEAANHEMGSVAAAVEEASTNLNTVASATEEASAGLKGVTGSTARMNRNVRTAADSVRVLTGSFSQVRGRCRQAEEESREAERQVRETADVMEKLAESASGIDQVVELITGIADQTNMLALNASIEAAGAGHAGRGFAVVANEIKALARQTSESTGRIEERTREIQQQTAGAMAATRSITQIIRRIGEANRGILQAVDVQASSADQVSEAMAEVARETEGVTRQVEEASAGLAEVARNVMEVSGGIMEVTRAVSETTTDLARVVGNVREASGGVEEIRREVEEAAQAARKVAGAMGEIDGSSREMQAMGLTVDQRAAVMVKLATEVKERLGRFQV